MNNGWLELESDPGVFTFLLEDFGVKGVQVEEIYDLQQKSMEGPVYGFIFLFRWIEERRSRRKVNMTEDTFVMDEDTINSIFFAQQVIPNSCATHALLSVLLNCEKVQLGETLSKLKQFTKHMSPENKGFAIGNLPDLAKAHYSHARPEPIQLPDKQQGVSTVHTMEAFHFVSYVPINGRLFELDGLKPHPVDHGPWNEDEDWTEKFRRVITERLGIATGGEPYHDIRFNLMAVVPDRRQQYEQKLITLKTNRQIVLETLQQMVKVTSPRAGQHDASTSGMEIDTESREIIGQLGAKGDSLKDSHILDESEIATAVTSATDEHQYVVVTCSGDVSNVTSITDSKLKIQISVADDAVGGITIPRTVAMTDVTKPLTIETKFSSGTSSGPSSESTDTASEVGSCLSSPNSTIQSCQNSPNLSEVGCKIKQEATSPDAVCAGLVTPKHETLSGGFEAAVSSRRQSNSEAESVTSSSSTTHGSSHSSKTKFSSRHGFTPKDLLALLKNVENEIEICEANLRDEIEKRSRYKIDDNRRTHNYDKFIFSFLTMLAEQGTLQKLVSEHCTVKRRQGVATGRLHQNKASATKRKTRGKRKR